MRFVTTGPFLTGRTYLSTMAPATSEPLRSDTAVPHVAGRSAPASSRIYGLLGLIVFLALLPRIYWMVKETPVISLEGSEYVRMAENLAHRHQLTGNFEGPETMYTPLYSVLTAGVSLINRNAETAAHLVGLVFGTLLIIPIFLIARRMYGLHVAFLSAVLAASHPLLIALCGSIYNENLYLPLLYGGIFFALRALELDTTRDYVLLSLCLSFAYLTRPEAFAYPPFFAVLVWGNILLRRISVGRAVQRSVLILGIFLLVASPYVIYLYSHTGHLRLEGKWNINYTMAQRTLAGMSRGEAAYGLASDATVSGPLLDPFHFAAFTPYRHSTIDKLRTLSGMAILNRKIVSQALLDRSLGSPLVLALVPIGLFRKSWSRRRLFQEFTVICIALSVLFLWVTSSSAEFRYIFPLVPLGIMWVSKGAEELGRWARSLVWSLGRVGQSISQKTAPAVEAALLALCVAIAFHSTGTDWLFRSEQRENLDIKEASIWLRNFSPGPKRIACIGSVPTYYAHGTLIGLPYASSADALRYLERKKVDFIVLDAQYGNDFPEVPDWNKNHIPDPRAHLIYEAGDDPTRKIEIYHWEKQKAGGQ